MLPFAVRLSPATSSQFQPISFCLAWSAVRQKAPRDGPASCWHPPGLCPALRLHPEAPGFGGPALAGKQASRRWAARRIWGQSSSSWGGTGRGWSCRTRTRSACGGTAPAGPPEWACACVLCLSCSPSSCSLRRHQEEVQSKNIHHSSKIYHSWKITN